MFAEELLGERMLLGALHGIGRGEDNFMPPIGDDQLQRLIFNRSDSDVQRNAVGNDVARIRVLKIAPDRGIVGFPDDRADGNGGEIDGAGGKDDFKSQI